MGILYPGEELVIYSRAFMELPMNSVTFRWTLNNSEFGLPSNMKVKEDGSSVVVKELRTSLDKVLTCSVYSNKNVFLAKRSFLFRKMASQNFLGGNFDQENPYFPPPLPPLRRKRSLNEIEGFVDDEEFEKPRLFQSKNYYGSSDFNFQNQIDHHNNNDRDTQDRFMNDVEDWYGPYPKLESPDIRLKNFQPEKRNPYRFYNSKSPDNFPLQDQTIEDTDPDFPNDPFRYKSNREKSPMKPRSFKNEYQNDQRNKYNSRAKKDVNRPSYEEQTRNQDQDGDQIDDLIQQANLLVQKTTEKNLKKVNAVNFEKNRRLSFDDEESALISNCKDNNDCSVHATCFKKSIGHYFCRCFPQYKGNGIFCWLV